MCNRRFAASRWYYPHLSPCLAWTTEGWTNCLRLYLPGDGDVSCCASQKKKKYTSSLLDQHQIYGSFPDKVGEKVVNTGLSQRSRRSRPTSQHPASKTCPDALDLA